MPTRQSLDVMTRDLVAVAAGRRPADLVLTNGQWVNVHSGEILAKTTVAACRSRIAYCGPHLPRLIGADTVVVDVEGRFLVPGLLDAHVHVESSMVTLPPFAASALRHGTTGAFIDPHEIANVLGLDGVRMMVAAARTTPMCIYVQVPSCVPAAPGLETAGANIGPDDVALAMTWDGIIGLGEVMNYPGVVQGDEDLHAEIAHTLRARRVVGGHYASEDLGPMFHAYAAVGPSDCHEGTRAEDVLARVRQGMCAILRDGSAEKNVGVQVRSLLSSRVDPRYVLLCTDDRHADLLVRRGHMDDVVRQAMQEGLDPMVALKMATINTAEHFGVAGDVGSIAPGRYADMLVVSELERLTIDRVVAAGELLPVEGWQPDLQTSSRTSAIARNSVHIERSITPDPFSISAPIEEGAVRCRVIEVMERQVTTRARVETVAVRDGRLAVSATPGLALLAVIDRHTARAGTGRGLVSGYGITQGFGLASTVAHDSHNLLVMGTDPVLMAQAANAVVAMAGGLCLTRSDREAVTVPLPIAGLMDDVPMATMARRMKRLQDALRDLGCPMEDALMSFSFLALPVIPALRLTDRGLVDVETFGIVSLFMDEDNPTQQEG